MSTSANLPLNRVLSVVLRADEDVQWLWTSTTEGVSYVSGYTIVKRESTPADASYVVAEEKT